VDDPAAVRALLPRAGGGHVLLTARSDVDWAGWAAPLPLDMLEPGDASGFLRDRSGDPDEAAAAALATELGRLPLPGTPSGSRSISPLSACCSIK
jgi:hypothetical protein